MAEEIEITIDKDGKTSIEGHGFEGKACHVIIEELARKIGRKTAEKMKPEFYKQKVKVGQKNTIRP